MAKLIWDRSGRVWKCNIKGWIISICFYADRAHLFLAALGVVDMDTTKHGSSWWGLHR